MDLLTVVGHKFGAPKGIAALYIRDGVHLARFLHGGGQVRERFEINAVSGRLELVSCVRPSLRSSGCHLGCRHICHVRK